MNAAVGVPIVLFHPLCEPIDVSVSTPLQLPPADKLDLLRYLDEFHYWDSLDDQRICKRCGQTITGRQITVIELQGTRGKLRLKCPTAGCASTPADWSYANPVQPGKSRAQSPTAARKDKAAVAAVAKERMHHGKRPTKRKVSPTTKPSSIFAPAPSFRALLARLLLVRPIATALHNFRPIS
jgi:hypothetical protein